MRVAYSQELISETPLVPSPLAEFEPASALFQRPGPDVLSATIPVVFIGRNRDGFWVARDAEAKFGGLFWRKQAALDFAKINAAPGGCAIVFPMTRFELDMQNRGNPTIGVLMAARRLLTRGARRLVAATRKLPIP
jgi:hypothetical protein